MKKIKIILSLLLICCLFYPITPINANELNYEDSKVGEINTEEVKTGREVTFEEMVTSIAERENISYQESLNRQLKSLFPEYARQESTFRIMKSNLISKAVGYKYWEDELYIHSDNKNYRATLYVYYSYVGTTARF